MINNNYSYDAPINNIYTSIYCTNIPALTNLENNIARGILRIPSRTQTTGGMQLVRILSCETLLVNSLTA